MDGIERFRAAQDEEFDGLADALAQLQSGRKRGHWIWYVFPQLSGLGSSGTSRRFGIQGREEAEAYLRDDVLRDRLARAVGVVAGHLGRPQPPRLEYLMGSHLDAVKLVSSLTLFEIVADGLNEREPREAYARLTDQARQVLAVAQSQGYERCAFTQRALSGTR